ncbi:MAG TPA: hypothetical protein VGD81_03710 [Opitutaceae bacterium]
MIAEHTFIASHQVVYPEWIQYPGVADLRRLFDLASELGISSGGGVFRDYDRVLASHRAGNPVLVRTEREPRRARSDEDGAEQIALVIEMDETRLTLWAPASDGSAETRSCARSSFWDAELATGIVLNALVPAEAPR